MHYLALAFAQLGHDVLYVDPPVSPLSLIRHPDRRADLFGPATLRPADHLEVWKPRVLPGQNSSVGQRVNATIVERGMARRLSQPDVVIVSSLEARNLTARL